MGFFEFYGDLKDGDPLVVTLTEGCREDFVNEWMESVRESYDDESLKDDGFCRERANDVFDSILSGHHPYDIYVLDDAVCVEDYEYDAVVSFGVFAGYDIDEDAIDEDEKMHDSRFNYYHDEYEYNGVSRSDFL